MATAPKTLMTVDEFLAWAEGQEGRFELDNGKVVAISPERARHAETKLATHVALRGAIRRAGIPCRVLPDGMTVRIDDRTAFEPDALVYCGAKIDSDAVEVQNPIVIVEVVLPGTGDYDAGAKLAGYFLVPSVKHYLIVDPVRKMVVHHARGQSEPILTRIIASGPVVLDPPGLQFDAAELFEES